MFEANLVESIVAAELSKKIAWILSQCQEDLQPARIRKTPEFNHLATVGEIIFNVAEISFNPQIVLSEVPLIDVLYGKTFGNVFSCKINHQSTGDN